MSSFQTLAWISKSRTLRLLDQRRLPNEEVFLECKTLSHVTDAIKTLAVRGAPAIGVAAAYGVVVGIQEELDRSRAISENKLAQIIAQLAATRPTAVNLFWALERMKKVAGRGFKNDLNGAELRDQMLKEADLIFAEDERDHRLLGQHG
ncbi:MAG: S-methyl-5-thioribose-1-phosphate isomerase, partial [Deltaproteobacteria bacterium]|nr:S-methyl-5-thioribose-1-phosphate isomerase [Deltaproteobacteria bacterium]